jgi:hypothetical protein
MEVRSDFSDLVFRRGGEVGFFRPRKARSDPDDVVLRRAEPSRAEPSRAEPSRAATPPQPSHDLATLAFRDQTSSSVGKARFELKYLVFRREGEV